MKARQPLPAIDSAQRYTPAEAASYLKISLWSVFLEIREGRLSSFKEGRRRFISGAALIARSRAPSPAPLDARASA